MDEDAVNDYVDHTQATIEAAPKIEQILKEFPNRPTDRIKETFLSSRSSKEPYQDQYGLHSPAIKHIKETETVKLYWQGRQGVGLLQQKNRCTCLARTDFAAIS